MRILLLVWATLDCLVCGVTTAQGREPAVANQIELSQRIDLIRPSVARVVAEFPAQGSSSAEISSAGSGFFINMEGDIVTAYHVVHPPGVSGDPTHISVQVRVPTIRNSVMSMLASFTGYSAKIKAVDVQHDIVVLELPDQNPFLHPPMVVSGLPIKIGKQVAYVSIEDALPKDGESIFISGFPLGFPTLITTVGYIASSDPIAVEGGIPNIQVKDVLWADIHANHGNSGGPVFSMKSGAVVGMQVGIQLTAVQFLDGDQQEAMGVQVVGPQQNLLRPISYNSGICRIIPSEYITALLRANNIAFNHKKLL